MPLLDQAPTKEIYRKQRLSEKKILADRLLGTRSSIRGGVGEDIIVYQLTETLRRLLDSLEECQPTES